MIDRAAITGAVLAGGEGRRMGGVDKGLVPLAGRPLIAWVLEALRPQVGGLLINANRSLDDYRAFGAPVVPDRLGGFLGPLAGMHAALAAAETEYALVTPCDTPRVPADLAARLGRVLQETGAEIAAAETGGFLQPLHVLLRTDLAADLAAALTGGVRKPEHWYATRVWVRVPCDDVAGAFDNVNTPDQREELETALREGAGPAADADQPPI